MELASDASMELASNALRRVRSFSTVTTSSESSHSEEVVFLCSAAEMRLTRVGFASFPTRGVFASSGARARRRGDVTMSELIAAELGDSIDVRMSTRTRSVKHRRQKVQGAERGRHWQRTTSSMYHSTKKSEIASAD